MADQTIDTQFAVQVRTIDKGVFVFLFTFLGFTWFLCRGLFGLGVLSFRRVRCRLFRWLSVASRLDNKLTLSTSLFTIC